jgi:hypothetical protein
MRADGKSPLNRDNGPSLRARAGLALHPRRPRHPPQRLHLLHLRRLDARHRAGRGRAHHRAVGDERLPEGSARPHAGVVSHIEVYGPGGGVLPDLERTCREVAPNPRWWAPRPSSRRRRCWRAARTCAAPSCAASTRSWSRRSPTWPRPCRPALDKLVPGQFGVVLGGRAGAQPGRARRRPGDADRAGRPGHAGRRRAAPEADDGGGHLRLRPLRIRQRPGAGAHRRRRAHLPAGRAPPACA